MNNSTQPSVINSEQMRPQTYRILVVLHMPWSRDLGAPRVSIELADEFEKHGYTVEKFDINDAFPKRTKLFSYFLMVFFPYKSARFVRKNAGRFDIIQAEQGNLPFSKAALNFHGVLVARSNGLAHLSEQYEREAARKRRRLKLRQGSFIGNMLRGLGHRMANLLPRVERSFRFADVILTINQDEFDYVVERLGHGDKTYLTPNGLSKKRLMEFASPSVLPLTRLCSRQISFIGSWSERKGALDFPSMVRRVRELLPDTSFLFLGTGLSQDTIRDCFDVVDRASIQVIPSFRSAELPGLLQEATAGVFPSYMEGFGIGVLEQLAAGIPTVAYDVPGPREMLRLFDEPLMVPAGDTMALAERLIRILTLSLPEYTLLSEESRRIAERFCWEDTADFLVNLFEEKRQELRQSCRNQ